MTYPKGRHPASLSNLKQYGGPTHTHGARGDVEPLADRHAERLCLRFRHEPDPELLRLQAVRSAMMQRLEDWLAVNGLFRRSPKGEVFNAVVMLDKLQQSYERLHLTMLERDRKAGDDGHGAYFESEARALSAGKDGADA